MAKPAPRRSLRGRAALGMKKLALSIQSASIAVAGVGQSGYASARNNRRTSGWLFGKGSPELDILTDLPELRGKSRDLARNHPLAAGALQTKTNGVVGSGLKLRSVIDGGALGIDDPEARSALQYKIEREWDIFEREADFTGQMHFKDLQRLIYRAAKESGDVAIARRWRKRPGDTYGTRVVVIEADRISNPRNCPNTATLQDGVVLSVDGEILGYWVTDRHPGDLTAASLKWSYVPRRGPSGMIQMSLLSQVYRPGQVRGVPLLAPVADTFKQMDDYVAAEAKAALNDAYLFATEEQATEVDDEGNPILTRPDGESDEAGELTLEDLTITTLPPGSKLTVKKPERPNTAFGDFLQSLAKYAGVAIGLPLEVLTMYFGSSFSASRGALELAGKGYGVDQDWLIRAALDLIREWQFTEMVAASRFDAPGYFDDVLMRLAWMGRIWMGPTRVQINPKVEAESDKIDVDMGSKTLEQVMTERTGGDFDTKSVQVKHEREVLGGGTSAATAGPPDQVDDPNAQPADGNEKDAPPK